MKMGSSSLSEQEKDSIQFNKYLVVTISAAEELVDALRQKPGHQDVATEHFITTRLSLTLTIKVSAWAHMLDC